MSDPRISVKERLPTEDNANELGEVYVAWQDQEDADSPVETRHWAAVAEDSVVSNDPELQNCITHWAYWELPQPPD